MPEIKDNLVKLMVSFDAPEGHVFIKEGDPIDSFLIVDSGSLVRTKEVSGGEPPLEIDTIGVGKHEYMIRYEIFLHKFFSAHTHTHTHTHTHLRPSNGLLTCCRACT